MAEFGLLTGTPSVGGQHRSAKSANRIASLDGLRGVAALVVLVHHIFLTQPALAAPYRDPVATDVGAMSWWATYTPLHLIWAGTEAVFVFFVLSGLVLALPVAERRRLNLWGYYPRRLLRLYLPVWAAVALAMLWAAAFPRSWHSGDSWWLVQNAADPSFADTFDDLFLLVSPGSTNHVLWSLQWEVIYCLALPLVLLLARTCRKIWYVKALIILTALVIGAGTGSVALSSLSMFALGTLMAVEHRKLAGWAARIQERRRPQAWWWAALVVCVGLLLSYWFVYASGARVELLEEMAATARGLQALGACLLVFIVWHWPTAQRFMKSSLMQWLGTRSFSLYLIHLPIVASVAVVLGGQPSLGMALALTAAIVFPVTEVFYRLVEQPSQRFAKRIGRMSADRAARAGSSDDGHCGPARDNHIGSKQALHQDSDRNHWQYSGAA